LNFGKSFDIKVKTIYFGNHQQARKCISAVKEVMMFMMPMKLTHHMPFLFALETLI